MRMKNWFILLSFSALLMVSCENDTKPVRKYENGVFVVNEGTFLAGNGSITFIDTASGSVSQNIFLNEAGEFAGDVVQSMTFHDGVPIIVVNGDNKVEIANGLTFRSMSTITDELIDKPRYVEVINNKGYISVWGPYDEQGNFTLTDSYVLVYNFATNSVIDTIQTDEGTENLAYTNDLLFVSNFNYGASNTVAVIDPTTNSLVDHIEVSAGPAGMVVDGSGKLWVMCVGSWDATNGHLYRINPETLEIEQEIVITGSVGMDLAITPTKDEILYTVGTSVFSIPTDATEEAAQELFDAEEVTSLSALNVDPKTGKIWIGDTPSFTAPGKVHVYSPTGQHLASFDSGIAPTQIVFKPESPDDL